MTRKILVFLALALAPSLSGAATLPPPLDLFVDARMGNDLGSCRTAGNSCRTIQAAIDRIPAVLTQDVTVHIASGTSLESLLMADRLAPQGHSLRLVGEPQATLKPTPSYAGDGVIVRRSPLLIMENLIIQRFPNGVMVRLSDLVVNNSRITGNVGDGIRSEKGWVILQAAAAGPGVTIQDNAGSGIFASCGSHVQFDGPVWIGQNATGLTATFAAVIDLNGRSDVTLTNAVVSPPPTTEPEPTTAPSGVGLPNDPRRILDAQVAPVSQCEMFSDHLGMIMGYANAHVVGVCACTAKDYSLCHPGTE
jgi:hypothetical protein